MGFQYRFLFVELFLTLAFVCEGTITLNESELFPLRESFV